MEFKFFNKIDWELLKSKKMNPPFIPIVRDEEDTSNINAKYLNAEVNESVNISSNTKHVDNFDGFTFPDPMK